jgi:hypothetical protein
MNSLAVVIPTRDRASLAIDAVRSLLGQRGCSLHVLVSDNSTDDDEVARLVRFCDRSADPRLTYLRPPEPLAMPAHWDWAIQEAMRRSPATHFSVHYDRRVSKPREYRHVLATIAAFPDQLITHTVDQVFEDPTSVVAQTPWTGRVYAVKTARVLEMVALGQVQELGQAFPVLSNCCIPRANLEAIRRRFGDICDSTGPDSCFCFRFCALSDGYLHLDRPLGINYASHRSNGLGYLRGSGGDFGDFVASWEDRPWLDAAPIPGLNLGQNMLFHEYELVRRVVGGDALPPLRKSGYLRSLAGGLRWVEDEEVKRRLVALLREHGWRPEPVAEAPRPDPEPRHHRRPKGLVGGLIGRARTRWAAFRYAPRVVLFLAALNNKPEHIAGYTFRSDRQALRHMLRCPRRQTPENEFLEPLQAVELRSGT